MADLTGLTLPRVAQVGTTMGGGVASVIGLTMAVVPASIVDAQSHVVTHDNGTKTGKVFAFARGVAVLLRDLAFHRHDLYHVHFSTGASTFRKIALVQIIRWFGRPVIGHAHGGKYEAFYAGLPAIGKAAVRRFIRQLDTLIVLSPQWADYFGRIVPAARIVIVPNAVRLPVETARDSALPLRVIALGQLGVAKGTQVLLDAMAILRATRSAVHLDFVGDGDVTKFQSSAETLGVDGNVTFHGWQRGEALDSLIGAASVFALPSFAEGLPMSMLECMARGMPVIVTAVGGIPSVVSDNVNGLIVPVGDAAALANAITRLADDTAERQRLGQAGRQTVAARYSADRYAQRIAAVYASLAPGGAALDATVQSTVQAKQPRRNNA